MFWLLLLLSIIPQPDGIYRDSVDMIEVNHTYHDKDGAHMVDQIIFWSVYPDGRLHVVDEYRKARHTGLPIRNWREGGYVLIWEERGSMRRVRSLTIDESWTVQADDPEVLDRKYVPKAERKMLSKIPEPKPFVQEWPAAAPTND
jgi:hypothetical protein